MVAVPKKKPASKKGAKAPGKKRDGKAAGGKSAKQKRKPLPPVGEPRPRKRPKGTPAPTPVSGIKRKREAAEAAGEQVVPLQPAEKCAPRAVEAAEKLLAFIASKEKDTRNLLTEREYLQLTVGFRQSIPGRHKSTRSVVKLPHRIVPEDAEVCLITPEPQRKFKDLVAKHDLGFVKRVIDIRKLRKKFKSYQEKRTLARSYDLFLCETKLWSFIPKALGQPFFDIGKEPLCVGLSRMPGSVTRALDCTSWHWKHEVNISVNIAPAEGFTAKQVAENAWRVLDSIVRNCPSGWLDINSAAIKGVTTPALTIYSHDFVTEQEQPVETYAHKARRRLTIAPDRSIAKRRRVHILKTKAPTKAAKSAAPPKEKAADDDDAESRLSSMSDVDEP